MPIDPPDINRHALRVVASLNEAYGIMYSGGMFLDQEDSTLLQQKLHRMGMSYQVLANKTAEARETRWKQPMKVHYAVGHLADQSRLINPRAVQCYAAEGLVGKIATIWKASQDGPHARVGQNKIMHKYTAGMSIDFS